MSTTSLRGTALAIVSGLVLAVIVTAIMRHFQLSVASLEQEFGPKRYSEENEELLIRHFFKDRKFGTFVDVGSGHYLQGSNTYFLEKELSWRGVAIDANAEYAEGYRAHRPATQFFPVFISDRSDEETDFFFAPRDPTKSSGQVEAVAGAGSVVKKRVPTATLNDLLRSNSITRFDFLSMDIELGEPKALAGFDIQRFRPALVCIEAHEPVQEALQAYFDQHGYRRLDEYLLVDQRNWYFSPR